MPKTPVLQPDLKRMGCGGCGGRTFTVFTADTKARISVQCQGRNSTSYIELALSFLRIERGEGDGRLALS